MAFKKGQSGNPGGRKKSLGLSAVVKKQCSLRAWKLLLDIMEEKIREQVVEMRDGEPVTVDVVPSIKLRLDAIKLVLAYTVGLPEKMVSELEQRVADLEWLLVQIKKGLHGSSGLEAQS